MLESIHKITYTEILAADHAKDHGSNAQLQQVGQHTHDQGYHKLQNQSYRCVAISNNGLGNQLQNTAEDTKKYCGSNQCGIMAFECVSGQCF